MRRYALCLLLVWASIAPAEEPSPVNISGVQTQGLQLYYYNYLKYLEPYAVSTFANSIAWQRQIFGWQPSEPTTVLLEDYRDYGGANTAARGLIVLSVAPKSHAFETYPASDRLYTLANHEMVHVVQSDIASEEDRGWRKFFFGKVGADRRNPETIFYSYLTMPRFTTPSWLAEGSAVFFETWMGGGLGRAQGGYDEMLFRTMVRDGAGFYDPLGLASRGTKVQFQTEANSYLYGTRFLTWLAYTNSPQKVVDLLRRDEGSKRYYTDQFEQVFGLPLERAWQQWVDFEQDFQRRNLTEVRRFPITPHRNLAGKAMGSISRMYFDEANATIYAAFRYPGVVEHVGALDTRDGSVRRIVNIKRALHYKVASFVYDPRSSTAFYTNNNSSLRDLMAVDVRTGDERVLIENGRIGEIVVDPFDGSLIGVRHEDGLATLVRIPAPYKDWKKVHTFAYGTVPYDLDISPDGRLLSASVAEVGGDQFLRVWNLQSVLDGNMKPISEYGFGQSVPESFVFSSDGRYLYGSSYYTGVSNIFRYEVATGKVEAMTNAETGFFRPVPLRDGRILVLTYTSEGFIPAMIENPRPLKDVSAIKFLGAELAAKHPIIKTWQVASPSSVDHEKLVRHREPYHPLHKLQVTSAYPVLQGYKNAAGLGYRVNIEDPLGFAEIGITAAYTPDDRLSSSERNHFDLKYRYGLWHAGLSWNRSDFYDLFGPTIRSRKGFAANIGYSKFFIFDEPRTLQLKSDFAFYDRLDRLPESQNVAATSTRLRTGNVGMYFSDVRRSLGGVDGERGLHWDVVFKVNHAEGQTTPQLRASLDVGFDLPLAHSSIWLRNSAGVAEGEHRNPYANFYFGGFGNNYVDSSTEKRYREHYAFPGFDINEIGGRSYNRHMVEWNIPPYVFESVGTPAFHLTWLRPAVFASALWTEPGNSTERRRFANLGAQVDLRFSVLHWYEMTLSIGYARGYRGSERAGSEWMISLKIM